MKAEIPVPVRKKIIQKVGNKVASKYEFTDYCRYYLWIFAQDVCKSFLGNSRELLLNERKHLVAQYAAYMMEQCTNRLNWTCWTAASSLDYWHPFKKRYGAMKHNWLESWTSSSFSVSHLSRLHVLRISARCRTHHLPRNLSMFRHSRWSWLQPQLFHTCRTPVCISHR